MFNFRLADKENARVAKALRPHIGSKGYDLDTLSSRTGIKRRTLQSYLSGQAEPPYAKLVPLMRELPESFTDEIIRPAGLGGVSRLSNETPDDMRLLALMNGASTEIAEAYAEKGSVCHIRRPRIVERLTAAYRIIGASLRRHSEARP